MAESLPAISAKVNHFSVAYTHILALAPSSYQFYTQQCLSLLLIHSEVFVDVDVSVLIHILQST